MSNLGHKLKHEVTGLIPVVLYFLVAFQLLALTQALMLREFGVKISSFLTAAIAALFVAKAVVIADHFRLVNRFPHKPLIYNILWKTVMYFVVSFAFRYVEHVIHFWRQTGSFDEANRRLLEEIVWAHFWAVQLWLFILLLIFCTIREQFRVMGRLQMVALFFGDPRNASASARK